MGNIIKQLRSLAYIVIITFITSLAYSDIELGVPQAPVTIIEYGSITCGKCVRFHKKILPLLISDYIETGKVRFIYRDYPTSNEAYRGAVAAHCAGPYKYYILLDALYDSVADWSQAKDVDTALVDIAVSLNLNRETFSKCLNDPQQALNIDNEREEAVLKYDVFGTPTFIVNGKVIRGLKTFDEMKLLIENAGSQSN